MAKLPERYVPMASALLTIIERAGVAGSNEALAPQ
jgi:hypothetical protein